MSESRYPVQVVRGVPVIAMPASLDQPAAGRLRATLRHLGSAGHVTVVIDMSVTVTCDAAGRAELARAYKHAAAEGGDLRLVAGSRALSDVPAGSGLDCVCAHFASVADAVAETPAVRIVPTRLARRPRPPRHSGSRPAPVPLPAR
jgi:anti-anti-sigma regulatory factor